MKLSELLKPIKEDFGSSDWHPIMKKMLADMEDGMTFKDAVESAAESVHDYLGYDDMGDTINRVMQVYRARFTKNLPIEEGMFVVKSKDGVEKRFKDAKSATALDWKDNIAKKPMPKIAVYSDAYWHDKIDNANDYNFVAPWDKIRSDTNAADEITKIAEDRFGPGLVDGFTFGKAGEMQRDGTTCATIEVRVMFEYGPGDDMGVTEPTSDMQTILVARNPQKPKQIDFIKYA